MTLYKAIMETIDKELWMDKELFGVSYVEIVKPNLFVRFWCWVLGKPSPFKMRRIDPRNIRVGKVEGGHYNKIPPCGDCSGRSMPCRSINCQYKKFTSKQ